MRNPCSGLVTHCHGGSLSTDNRQENSARASRPSTSLSSAARHSDSTRRGLFAKDWIVVGQHSNCPSWCTDLQSAIRACRNILVHGRRHGDSGLANSARKGNAPPSFPSTSSHDFPFGSRQTPRLDLRRVLAVKNGRESARGPLMSYTASGGLAKSKQGHRAPKKAWTWM
jgi:hypothetical protein